MKQKSTRIKIVTGMAAAMLALPMVCSARPANPTPWTIIQPDGSELTIRLAGDENCNAYFTADGYLLMGTMEEGLTYATLDANGLPASSGLLARNPELRSQADLELLKSMTPAVTLSALEKRDAPIKAHLKTRGPGICPSSLEAKGEKKCLVILVNYNDRKFFYDDEKCHEFYEEWLNGDRFTTNGATGSCRQYMLDNSMGQFAPHFDLYGPVTLPKNMKYYGANSGGRTDIKAHEMVTDAARILKEDPEVEINFADYDNDGDGIVDNIVIIYAGKGESDQGGDTTVWPHSSSLSMRDFNVTRYDDVKLDHYACINELASASKKPTGIGGFLHEFSHVMGLPDLYATNYQQILTPGDYSILDHGSYNNMDRTPAGYSAFERYALDWMEPEEIYDSGEYTLEHLMSSNKAYKITNDDDPNEFFIFENRQKKGWDEYIPGHGMLIWHIKYVRNSFENNTLNNDPKMQLVDIEEADQKFGESDRNGDTFPGTSDVTDFGFLTIPAMKFWADDAPKPGVEIYNIKESSNKITFFAESSRENPNNAGINNIGEGSSLTYNLTGRMLNVNAGSPCEVYDAMGRLIAAADNNLLTELPSAGVFIIRANGKTIKVLAN